jgi:DNA polymerase-3 subunit alpha
LQELREHPEGQELQLGGRIDAMRVINTSTGKRMAFVRLEDLSGQVEVTVFPDSFEQAKKILKEDQVIWLRGHTERRTERSNGLQVVAEELLSLEEAERSVQLHLQVDPDQVEGQFVHELKELLSTSPGASPVYVRLMGDEPVTIRLGVSVGLTHALLKRLERLLGDPARIQRIARKGGRER